MGRLRRRQVLMVSSALLMAPGALAQTSRRFRVACLWISDEINVRPFQEALLAGLRERGYVRGRNLELHVRHARGDISNLPALADELIALRPDVLIGLEVVALVLRAKTTTIPIVLPTSTDPVAAGLAQSLSRPGTNVTGIASVNDQLVAKHVELLAEILPKGSRIALLNDPLSSAATRFEQSARTAAAAKGFALNVVDVSEPNGVGRAFATLERERPHGIVIVGTGRLYQFSKEILDHVRRLRLPAIAGVPNWAAAGGLISYTTDVVEGFRYSARYVDRILKGASPADLPIEQNSKFEFVINLKAARELGLPIPPAILLRADRVIE